MTILTARPPLSPKAKPRRQPKLPGLTALQWTADPGPTKKPLSRLLILDAQGEVKVFFLAKLPDPLILAHHLSRLTAD